MSKKKFEIDAIITYIHEDFSHGYVKEIRDFNKLDRTYLADKSISTYKFIPDPESEPAVNQIVRIQQKSNSKEVIIVENVYVGLKRSNSQITPLDSKFYGNQGVVYITNPNQEAESIENEEILLVEFFLKFYPSARKLKATDIELIDPTLEHYETASQTLISYSSIFEKIGDSKLKVFVDFVSNSENFISLVYVEGKKILDNLISSQDTLGSSNFKLKNKFLNIYGRFGKKIIDIETAQIFFGLSLVELIRAWIKGVFPIDFLSPQDLIRFNGEVCFLNALTSAEIEEIFTLHSQENNQELYINLLKNKEIDDLETFDFFQELIEKNDLNQNCFSVLSDSLSASLSIKLWRTEKLILSKEFIKTHLGTFGQEDLDLIFKRYPIDDLRIILDNLKVDTEEIFDSILEKVIDPILKDFGICVFDTEINAATEKMVEYAWITSEEVFEEPDVNESNIKLLQEKILSSKLIVGHNIEKFDYNYVFLNDTRPFKTWDTLKVEAFLDPEKSSYALKTVHEALEDCFLTKQLFLLQLFRVKLLFDEQKNLEFISDEFQDIFNSLPKILLSTLVIESYNKRIFRTFNTSSLEYIRDQIPDNLKLLISPRSYWDCFISYNGIYKDKKDEELNLVFSSEIVKTKLKSTPYLLESILGFIESCNEKGIAPFLRNLSPYLKSSIYEIIPPEQLCFQIEEDLDFMLVSPYYYLKNREILLSNYNESEICFLGINLWKYETTKHLKKYHIEELENNSESKDLWVHFSNGKSVAPLPVNFISELNESYFLGANYWIEKNGINDYDLNCSIPEIIEFREENCFFKISFDIDRKTSDLNHEIILLRSEKNLVSRLELNPETLYRDLYWNERLHVITEFFKGKNQEHKKIVFIVEKSNEIPTIQKIFRDLSIYCPHEDANIQRRFELLQDCHKGILVCDYGSLDKILMCSSIDPVSFILESLRPNELLIQSGQSFTNISVNTAVSDDAIDLTEEEIDSKNEDQEIPHLGASTNKLGKLNDYYSWLFFRILLHNSNNRIATLDQRITSSTFDRIKVKTISIDINEGKSSKNKISRIISSRTSSLFHAPKKFELGQTDPHVARIASIFLKNKGDGNFIPSQREYLDYILPANQDVLITLPTGTGKSVLFQGPSLYRSSYTGKLSLVVTPLKALMEDHVLSLWKLGFWNSVEYINSDKGNEVKDIYRRIAGGELLMVFITPERFRSRGFIKAINQRLEIDGSFEYVIFDEAHCISQWGSEFRPDYFYCAKQIRTIRKNYDSPVLLLSATVTKHVAKSIETVLYEKV
jgi:DNA polymerase III epsilon subunit-like protein